jgi:hypothetical protein
MVIAKRPTFFSSAEKRLAQVLLLMAHVWMKMLAGDGHCEGQSGLAG